MTHSFSAREGSCQAVSIHKVQEMLVTVVEKLESISSNIVSYIDIVLVYNLMSSDSPFSIQRQERNKSHVHKEVSVCLYVLMCMQGPSTFSNRHFNKS